MSDRELAWSTAFTTVGIRRVAPLLALMGVPAEMAASPGRLQDVAQAFLELTGETVGARGDRRDPEC